MPNKLTFQMFSRLTISKDDLEGLYSLRYCNNDSGMLKVLDSLRNYEMLRHDEYFNNLFGDLFRQIYNDHRYIICKNENGIKVAWLYFAPDTLGKSDSIATQIYVRSDYRRQGIASTMIDMTFEYMLKLNGAEFCMKFCPHSSPSLLFLVYMRGFYGNRFVKGNFNDIIKPYTNALSYCEF